MTARQTIIVHIGMEKTATTSFQEFCRDHYSALKSRGLLYAKAARDNGRRVNHRKLVESYLGDAMRDRPRWEPSVARQDYVRAITAEARAHPGATILISAEYFSSRFDDAAVQRLAEDFADFELHILVAVRDHHARFFSAYGTFVLGGYDRPLAEFADGYLAPNARYMSVRQTLEPWQNTFGAERIAVLDYDAEPDILSALLQRCGVASPPREARPRRAMASPPPDVVRALQLANRTIRRRQTVRAEDNHAAWYQLELFSMRCHRQLAAAAAKQPLRPWGLSAERLQRLDELASADRLWLEANYGLAMRGSNARSRIVVTPAMPAPTPAEDLLANVLVDRATFGLWKAAEAGVALWSRAVDRLPRREPAA